MGGHDDGTTAWVTIQQDGRLSARAVQRCRVRVARGPDKGRQEIVDKPVFRVGAAPGNDLVLTDPAVSGHHFELRIEDDGVALRDLGSRNGTIVGELRVREALLPAKAKIEVGESQLLLDLADGRADVAASAAESFGPLYGASLPMRELYAQLEVVARSDATVLITGETGTGKELVAEALVAASKRADRPLVVVDCGALAPTLVESELFGHEKGAFTGATSATAGAFERADGGTILLDEIGELPTELQPKLLRALEKREVRRVGSGSVRSVDIRVLAATHRRLEEEVNRGTFRADLFYRLSVMTVYVPALRERIDDVPLLAERFLSGIPSADRSVLSKAVVEALCRHSWPGNVRELKNAVERLSIGADPLGSGPVAPSAAMPTVDLDTPFAVQKEQLVRAFERRYAEALLSYSPDNLARAARKAGLDRMAVIKLLHRHGLGRSERP